MSLSLIKLLAPIAVELVQAKFEARFDAAPKNVVFTKALVDTLAQFAPNTLLFDEPVAALFIHELYPKILLLLEAML